jgi:hypothetical protein
VATETEPPIEAPSGIQFDLEPEEPIDYQVFVDSLEPFRADAVVMRAGPILNVFGVVAVSILLAGGMLGYLVFSKAKIGRLTLIGGFAALCLFIYYGYMIFGIFFGPTEVGEVRAGHGPSFEEAAQPDGLAWVLFSCEYPAGAPTSDICIGQSEVDAFVKTHFVLKAGGKTSGWAMRRSAVNVLFREDCIVVLEQIEWLNRRMVLRFEVPHGTEERPGFDDARVSLGNRGLPGLIAAPLLRGLGRDVVGLLNYVRVPGRFQIVHVSNGTITLRPIHRPE